MTSSASAARLSPPPESAAESFSQFTLNGPTCCVVQLAHQRDGVVHQVVLDPAKIKDALIRLGDWPGDEANGWQLIANVRVLAVLGRASLADGGKTLVVTPLEHAERLEKALAKIAERAETGPDLVDG